MEIGDDIGNVCRAYINHNNVVPDPPHSAQRMALWHMNDGAKGGLKRGDILLITSYCVHTIADYGSQKYYNMRIMGPIFHYRSNNTDYRVRGVTHNLSVVDWQRVLEASPEIDIETAQQIAQGQGDALPVHSFVTVRGVTIDSVTNVFSLRNSDQKELIATTEPGIVRLGVDGAKRRLKPGDRVKYELKMFLKSENPKSPLLFVRGWKQVGEDIFCGATARELFGTVNDVALHAIVMGLRDFKVDALLRLWRCNRTQTTEWTILKVALNKDEEEEEEEDLHLPLTQLE